MGGRQEGQGVRATWPTMFSLKDGGWGVRKELRNEESFWKLGMALNWQLQKNDDFLVTIARNELCQQPEWVRKWNLSRAFRKDCDPADAMSDIWPYRTVRRHICVILSHLCVAICECNDTKIIQPLTTSKLPIVIMWSVEKVDTLCNSTWPRI